MAFDPDPLALLVCDARRLHDALNALNANAITGQDKGH